MTNATGHTSCDKYYFTWMQCYKCNMTNAMLQIQCDKCNLSTSSSVAKWLSGGYLKLSKISTSEYLDEWPSGGLFFLYDTKKHATTTISIKNLILKGTHCNYVSNGAECLLAVTTWFFCDYSSNILGEKINVQMQCHKCNAKTAMW